jgi:alkylation response protein AidB-like acyl-CoA dehydrogenase
VDVERGYRDSRINRIFEGTNEINRLLVSDTAMKRAMKGDFDLFGEAEILYNNLENITAPALAGLTYFQEKQAFIKNFKKTILLCMHGSVRQFGKNLVNEQEVMNNIAEMMMEVYASESLALRIEKMEGMKGKVPVYRDILDVNIYDTAEKVRKSATDAINSLGYDGPADNLINAIEVLSKVRGINIKDARRRIADKLIEDNSYKF